MEILNTNWHVRCSQPLLFTAVSFHFAPDFYLKVSSKIVCCFNRNLVQSVRCNSILSLVGVWSKCSLYHVSLTIISAVLYSCVIGQQVNWSWLRGYNTVWVQLLFIHKALSWLYLTTCFGLTGHLQVCLGKVAAADAMQWTALASGFMCGWLFLIVLYVVSLCVPAESWLCCFAVRPSQMVL
jgi:hypothetical protein